MRDFYEVFGFIGVIFGIFVGVVGGIAVLGLVLLDRPTCHATYDQMGLKNSWSLWTGCMVEAENGQWLPADLYLRTHYADQHTINLKEQQK